MQQKETSEEEREELHAKWDMPPVPGVIEPDDCGSVALMFVKLFVEFLRLDTDALVAQSVQKMRKDLLLLLKEKEFAPRSEYRSGQHPVEVAVTCAAPACGMVAV